MSRAAVDPVRLTPPPDGPSRRYVAIVLAFAIALALIGAALTH